MKLPRRFAVAGIDCTYRCSRLWVHQHVAQSAFPSKPIRLIVGSPPGGAPDIVARIVAQSMNLGQPVIVENRNGAASMIAAEAVARAAPDGTTLLIGSQTVMAVAPIINKVKSFDPQKDFTGVALIGSAPLVLVAGAALACEKHFGNHRTGEI
jgi:tripartite-type tricarboxylate transporter receptor subunit TctC